MGKDDKSPKKDQHHPYHPKDYNPRPYGWGELRNWNTNDSQKLVKSTFLDFVAWLRAGKKEYQVADDNGSGGSSRIGHLDVDYDNLHIVAAMLTQTSLEHYDRNSDVKTRRPLEDSE